MTTTFSKTPRNKVRRGAKRATYEVETVNAILDAGFICHIGFVVDGQPFVIPTAYGRVESKLLIHGSPASRMLKTLEQGIDVCVTVTLLDGLVLARSAFHHSLNYRSVVLFGRAHPVNDLEEKAQALKAFTDQVIPNRWSSLRPMTDLEVKATTVLSLPITEASAKVRTGPPVDDEADYALPIWAGVLPLRMVADAPIRDPRLPAGIPIPDHVQPSATPWQAPQTLGG
ncbi:MAG: pyridoxamine 5'-phosphate oxidase family protein [Cyanobacteria bacterium P01_A01_bin.105]